MMQIHAPKILKSRNELKIRAPIIRAHYVLYVILNNESNTLLFMGRVCSICLRSLDHNYELLDKLISVLFYAGLLVWSGLL